MEEGEDNDGLVRHVWDQYTNSKTDLTKARDRLGNISALRTPVSLLEMTSGRDNIATDPKEEVTKQSKPVSGKVEAPEDSKSKVLPLNKKPSMNLTGTGSKDSESVGSALIRMFGSKVGNTHHCLLKSSTPHCAGELLPSDAAPVCLPPPLPRPSHPHGEGGFLR